MSRREMVALLCASLLLTGGCVAPGHTEDTGEEWLVYYSALSDPEGEQALAGEYRTLPDQDSKIPALFSLMLEQPETPGLTSPLPQGLRLLEWQLEEGQLHLDFSEQFYSLSGVDLALADACLTLTFCQMEEVSGLYVTVEGRELPYRPIQRLSANDILLTGGVDEPVEVWVDLWYWYRGTDSLAVERRCIVKEPEQTMVQALLTAWAELAEEDAALPAGTQIRSVELSGGVCIVDLSSQFALGLPQDRQQAALMVYAMVNTLCQLEGVESVQLYMEGEPAPVLRELPLDRPLLPDATLRE
ncbi:GerMN domain-containing protein [Pseudoflavonifractor phocaeensis]|uniref:GerMN domain-containing protein n=1 Tax=Pseudoflavonifractor phocaeensis TaxID=1870988 RepID=UPI001957E1AD|nr:GerMN domain-containing protein [Pseudoflavonifractor phocaeensis]MBM6926252.1 GerMN domain-containing protein [Pseudoflavonifractor phocaeensis]